MVLKIGCTGAATVTRTALIHHHTVLCVYTVNRCPTGTALIRVYASIMTYGAVWIAIKGSWDIKICMLWFTHCGRCPRVWTHRSHSNKCTRKHILRCSLACGSVWGGKFQHLLSFMIGWGSRMILETRMMLWFTHCGRCPRMWTHRSHPNKNVPTAVQAHIAAAGQRLRWHVPWRTCFFYDWMRV